MFRLENIHFLYGLAAIPLLVLLFIWMQLWKTRALKKFGDTEIVNQLITEASNVKPVLKIIILSVAFLFLIIGIVNPQVGSKLEEVKREGADIIIALDVSNSMKAEDIAPNRLEKAKQAIQKLIDRLQGDRIGMIVFAGQAYVQLPITTDYAAAKLFLGNIDTDIVPTQGTAIGSAIDLAIESFGSEDGKNKAIIIISDGENHEDDAVKAAQAAAEKGITVHTIGMGSPLGVPIPIYKNKVQIGYKKDKEGNTVITKLNEQALQEIASGGNGTYVHASNSDIGLNAILDEVKKLEKKQFESKLFTDYDDKFYYFIAIALLLFVSELLISERKSKWFAQLNLFNETHPS